MLSEQKILSKLRQIRKGAFAEYSNFKVAALLFSSEGKMYSGINIESSSYGLTICAERVALFKALSEGVREFERICILSDLNKPCPPCGACRQLLMDYASDINVMMFGEDGLMVESKLKDLLPFAFGSEALKKR
jgi:cytidine deaminase